MNHYLTDWLLKRYRKIHQKKEKPGLLTSYLTDRKLDSFSDKELLFNLFRFLSFIQSYEGKREKIIINEDPYCKISFPLADLVTHLYMDKKNKRHTKKVSQILKKLVRLEPIIENFSDIHFRALVLFPNIKVLQKGRISLKKYYESKEEYSLFQLKGYSIKYESIRRTKLYQQIKQ